MLITTQRKAASKDYKKESPPKNCNAATSYGVAYTGTGMAHGGCRVAHRTGFDSQSSYHRTDGRGNNMNEGVIKKLIAEGRVHEFYVSPEWHHLRSAVLADDKHECQMCKAHGIYTPATTVHHINYLRKRPDLALSRYYIGADGEQHRNLISLCHDCHEKIHGYRQKEKPKPVTNERW